MKRKSGNKSITHRSILSTVISCTVLGLTALAIGLSVFASTMFQQDVRHAFDTASHASNSAVHGADSITLAREVMEIYQGLTPEQREKVGTEEYRSYFSSIDTELGKGGTWDVLVHMLSSFIIDVDDVYLAMYDEETCAMVYIADPDEEDRLYPGEWESVNREGMERFLNWDGEGMLYDIDKTEKYGWLCTAGYPIRDEQGVIREFLLVDLTVQNVVEGMVDFSVRMILGLVLITLVIAYQASHHIKKTVADPVDAIAHAATEYVKGRKAGSDQSFFRDLDIRTGDELENLRDVMAEMEESLAIHEENIRAITAEKERINTELNLANRIQESMLPQVFPPYPERKEFDIYASMTPAREVGGDFYDFFLIDEDHLAMVIADVSGKGIPAALYMMISKTILQSVAKMGSDAREVLNQTNAALSENNETEMFVTVWIGILEISTGIMSCSNAGHEYPAIYSASQGSFRIFKDKHGLVIGAMEGMQYSQYEIRLEKEDKIFVYTDGVPEAEDGEGKMFGMDRMLTALNRNPEGSPRQILESVRKAVDAFVGDAEQFDDLTMLCLQYKGKA